MSEGVTNPDNLFNLFDLSVATVSIVTNSGDGSEEGLVGGDVISEWNGVSSSAKWRWHSNGGIWMYGWRYEWWDVFLVRVVELAGSGFV